MIEESMNFLIERVPEELEKINIAGTTMTVALSSFLKEILDSVRKHFPERQNMFEEIVSEKLKKVTGEELTEPNAHIAVSLLYLNAFVDSNKLRELFANLLVASMRRETQPFAHISFVRVLEQMSPEEALLIKSTSILRYYNPVARISYQKRADRDSRFTELFGKSYTGQSFKDNDLFFDATTSKGLFHHITLFDIGLSYEQMSFLIDNLARLNLIEINYSGSVDVENYKNFKRVKVMDEIMQKLKDDGETDEDYHLVYNPGAIAPTEYGKKFYEICVK